MNTLVYFNTVYTVHCIIIINYNNYYTDDHID